MANCQHPCTDGRKTDLKLSSLRVNSPATPNQTLDVSVDVTDTSWVVGGPYEFDVIDTFNNNCLYNHANSWLGQGQTYVESFQITMPSDRDLTIRASVSTWSGIGWTCEDVKTQTITLYDPNATTSQCASDGSCQPRTCNTSLPNCFSDTNCGGKSCPKLKGQQQCTVNSDCLNAGDMCLMGSCVSKQLIFIAGALVLIYVYTKQQS